MTLAERLHILRMLRAWRMDIQALLASNAYSLKRFPGKPPYLGPEEESGWTRFLAALNQQIQLVEDMLQARKPYGRLRDPPDPQTRR
jgi:hypothetical protein